MTEIMNLLMQLIRDFAFIRTYILNLKKSKLDHFKETWVDSQDVMQSLHISKRTLQTLRDSKILGHSRIQGKFFYRVSDIEKMLESNYSPSKFESHDNK